MISDSDDLTSSQPGGASTARLDSLFERLCDQVISPEEIQELNDVLKNDATARVAYLQCLRLHSALPMAAGDFYSSDASTGTSAEPDGAADSTESCELLLASLPQVELGRFVPWARRLSRRAIAIAAALAAVLVATVSLVSLVRSSSEDSAQAVAAATGENQSINASQDSDVSMVVARIASISADVVWRDDNDAMSIDSSVHAGQALALMRGEIQLAYDSGVQLQLLGPADFVPQANGGRLRRGGLRALVSEQGRGFTIETPNGRVVDLGTEFGVAVDDFGVAEVSVFQGKVDAFPRDAGDGAANAIRLTEGQAVLWNREALIHIAADPLRFASSRDRMAVDPDVTGGEPLVAEDLRQDPLATDRWTTHGNVANSAAGLVLTGDGTSGNVPHLISTQQFNTSDGPVTVVCDLHFQTIGSAVLPSFALLTRSSALRDADAPEGWDTMHTCVRCRLKSQDVSLSGGVEAAVKMDRECPLTNILWRGFQRLDVDVPYRLVMTDDGVNVTFTVSLVEDPTIQKTITCRSLFRGKQNFIALEGAAEGAVVVEKIRVYQKPTSASSRENASALEPPVAASSGAPAAIDRRVLATLAPDDGVLAISDDFESGSLDRKVWSTLGEVAVADGRLQLGAANSDEHINTWTARPYLLTRRTFTPSAGAVTITGTIKFAKNFLHEYGGSFAVMTRAVDRLGAGPGWEYSVLQSGIRANFWPAAWGAEHSLEIHEKPTPSMLSLLVAKGLKINPDQRAYGFKVVDDGSRVTLTIIDVADPSIAATVSAPTADAARDGIVGLESCWGCPVWLDNVRIYESPQQAPPSVIQNR